MVDIPKQMRGLVLADYCTPDKFDVATLDTPQITKPDQLLIKVHGASINPIDVLLASGAFKDIMPLSFPSQVGGDGAGTVVAVGSAVKDFKVGDNVYTRVPHDATGFVAEYALSTEGTTALAPKTLGLTEAASVPLATLTAYEVLLTANEQLSGGLRGKTVFVPGGLSATGNVALQLLRNVFQAGKIITTLSTGKITDGTLEKMIGTGIVDQVIDYTKDDVVSKIGRNSVDFFFDTVGGAMTYLPVMKKNSVLLSVSTTPSGEQAKMISPNLSIITRTILNLIHYVSVFRAWRQGASYDYYFMYPSQERLNELAKYIDEGKLKTVVGRTAKLSDVEGVRAGCLEVSGKKGGVGKFVIEMN